MEPASDPFAPYERFARLVSGAPDATPLDEAALAVAAILRRGVDPDESLVTLDALAAECRTPTFDGLRSHLWRDLGFGGGQGGDDPALSFLDLVLARRVGLPLLLGTVMIEVGRRVGVPVLGVNLPFHFVVCDPSREDVYVDPLTGAVCRGDELRALVARRSQGRLRCSDAHLRPVPARHIVVRLLTNLQGSYQRRSDALRLAMVARLRASIPELAPEIPQATRLGAVWN